MKNEHVISKGEVVLTCGLGIEQGLDISKHKVSPVGHLATGAGGLNTSERESEQCDERKELHDLAQRGEGVSEFLMRQRGQILRCFIASVARGVGKRHCYSESKFRINTFPNKSMERDGQITPTLGTENRRLMMPVMNISSKRYRTIVHM